MKRILAFALSLALLLGCCFAITMTASAATEGDYTYRISYQKAIITDYIGDSEVITIPSTLGGYPVTAIDSNAFSNCDSLFSVTIPSGVQTIGNSAFYRCTSLCAISIPVSVNTIQANVFKDCVCLNYIYYSGTETQWNQISIAANNTELADATIHFEADMSDAALYLKYTVADGKVTITDCEVSIVGDLIIPATLDGYPVTAIRNEAFSYCNYLTSVTIPDSVQTIGNTAFSNCVSLSRIWVAENNPNYSSDDRGVLFDKNKTELLQVPDAISGDYTIPDSVQTIGNWAFSRCVSLITVTIGNSVQTIGKYAFDGCTSLTSVTIGNSVQTIGYGAFFGCASLTAVTIPDSVQTIGYVAFFGCASLTSVTIGNSVQTIGNSAFSGCYNLTDVYYNGTEKQWNQILILPQNEYLTNATIHYNHVHDYSVIPPVTVDATCTQEGYIEYTCLCEETYREVLPMIPHSYTENVTVVAPTCTEGGYTTATCSMCAGQTQTNSVPALGHDEVAHDAQEATCTEIGWEAYVTCSRCDYTTYAEITALGHDAVVIPAVAPTCTATGLTEGSCCSRCQLILTEQAEVPALGHSFTDGVCTVCGAPDAIPGELDGDGEVSENDAIYLLQYILMPDLFQVSQDADFDKDGEVNEDDAIYLLQHILMPDLFPL